MILDPSGVPKLLLSTSLLQEKKPQSPKNPAALSERCMDKRILLAGKADRGVSEKKGGRLHRRRQQPGGGPSHPPQVMPTLPGKYHSRVPSHRLTWQVSAVSSQAVGQLLHFEASEKLQGSCAGGSRHLQTAGVAPPDESMQAVCRQAFKICHRPLAPPLFCNELSWEAKEHSIIYEDEAAFPLKPMQFSTSQGSTSCR